MWTTFLVPPATLPAPPPRGFAARSPFRPLAPAARRGERVSNRRNGMARRSQAWRVTVDELPHAIKTSRFAQWWRQTFSVDRELPRDEIELATLLYHGGDLNLSLVEREIRLQAEADRLIVVIAH